VHAAHAEFQRAEQLCILTQAQAQYSGGSADAALARLRFREDGTIEQMQGSGGVDLHSASGAHVSAPQGVLVFDEDNHPRTGDLTGGTRLIMQTAANQQSRDVEGSAPSAHVIFDNKGDLRQAHLERGVLFHTRQKGTSAKGAVIESNRTWSSAIADIDFAHSEGQAHGATKAGGAGHAEPRVMRGFGGVTITSETIANGRTVPARLSADSVVAELAPGSVLTHLTGSGHAHFEQQTAQGARQTSSSDQLDVHFAPASSGTESNPVKTASASSAPAVEIETMHQSGHVVLTQTPAPAKPDATEQAPMRATAESSDYDGKTETLHLIGSAQGGPPRVQQGALDLTAQSIDFTRSTGDALAHGDVRASWSNNGAQKSAALPGAALLAGAPSAGTNDNGPVHAIAAEAELRQSTQEIFLRAASGNAPQARLWQAGNSVSAPLIVLNRQKMTLVAQTASAASPVRTVLLGNAPTAKNNVGTNSSDHTAANQAFSKAKSLSILRMRSGDLRYSEGERLALFHAGVLGSVTAETIENGALATITAQQAQVRLAPADVHGSDRKSEKTSVERMTAQGRVSVDFPDRHGTGDRLVYLGEDGTFTLTGTGANAPQMTDAERGAVTGAALVYHSRDRSVSVEGQGAKTSTETRSPK
jgi:lipopolysaccharide export system protein LptA